MATDPNLNPDTCIFMQPGAAPNWWLSDDVKLAAASGVAVPGQKNDVNIIVRRKPQGCTLPNETDYVKVDLYVCNPTASPMTTSSPNVKKILDATGPPSEILVDIASLPSGGNFAQTVKWDLPPLSATSHPAETAGHKCLIARAYPNPLSGGINIGDYAAPPPDQHYAQRNICIQTCSSPCGIDVWTENLDRERAKNVKFEVIADTNPSEAVLKVALPLLKEIPGFRRVVKGTPRKGFGLEFPDFPDARKTDNTRPGCLGGISKIFGLGGTAFRPSFAAEVKVSPGQFSIYRFVTDLDGAESGDAFIFHLRHIERENVLSGLTMLMVKN
ncbi:MAG TPA: hypothetical protein VK892_09345 [Pyrinomonadaceae bacterium]|nr:hypothetical protein [Pyrinomonadaceae bacterium]